MTDSLTLVLVSFALVFVGGIAALLLQRKFGSYRRFIVGLKRDDINRIKATRKSYNAGRTRGKPEPPRAYVKAMFTDSGIAVYQNGIVADFCVGELCKYRFAPFADISGIYPVKIREERGLAGSVKTRDGLQIETVDMMVFIVDSARHDLTKFVATMKQMMAGTWDRVYRRDELLWKRFGGGDAYVHKMIRIQRPPAGTPRITEAARTPSLLIGTKGSLLLEQSNEDLAPERARLARWIVLSMLGMPAFTVAAVLLQEQNLIPGFRSLPLCILPYLLYGLGVAMIFVTMLGFFASMRVRPIRIYENGVEQSYLGEIATFKPWGEFVEVSEERFLFLGGMYRFKSRVYGYDVFVQKSARGLPELMPEIKKKLAKPENVLVLDKQREVESRGGFMRR